MPDIDGDSYYGWLAARMRNYMIHLIRTAGYTPRYYDPASGKEILAHHVARYFGVETARMLRGFPSYEETWSSRESLLEIGIAVESMPLGAMQDMNRCMHFCDDWEIDESIDWDTVYPDPRRDSPQTSKHRRKFCIIEDAFNDAWTKHISFGVWLTFDESRIAGWYHSALTIGPEPKPIRTGATVHSMCVTKGPMSTYMIRVRTYGGKSDETLRRKTPNTGSVQIFINLLH